MYTIRYLDTNSILKIKERHYFISNLSIKPTLIILWAVSLPPTLILVLHFHLSAHCKSWRTSTYYSFTINQSRGYNYIDAI